MNQNKFGQLVFSESDVYSLLMQGREIDKLTNVTVDTTIDVDQLITTFDDIKSLTTWKTPVNENRSIEEFHLHQQLNWHMPDEYNQLDIAAYILSLCSTESELQRVGQELLLYQERDLFGLLRYLKYLVDVMKTNHIIWGVGRGSSVASYVLYKMGVHRINSMYYELNPEEFLR
jgi:DNA polymerase-3 subunit alpha